MFTLYTEAKKCQQNLRVFTHRYNISFIDPPLVGFGEISSELVIFPEGLFPAGKLVKLQKTHEFVHLIQNHADLHEL
jgi:hypothetical protein